MSRNRKERSCRCNCESVSDYIPDVFKRGKSERYKYGVDDSVESKIKMRVAPRNSLHKDVLCSLFYYGDHQECQYNYIERVRHAYKSIEHRYRKCLETSGKERGNNAKSEQLQKEAGRFFFYRVLSVYIKQKKGGWKYCRYYIYDSNRY